MREFLTAFSDEHGDEGDTPKGGCDVWVWKKKLCLLVSFLQ